MKREVWKFPVGMPGETARAWVDLPASAVVLNVGLQEDEMVLWALVDPEDDQQILYRLIVVNTGRDIPGFPEGVRFLSTLTTSNGVVWHVFVDDLQVAE